MRLVCMMCKYFLLGCELTIKAQKSVLLKMKDAKLQAVENVKTRSARELETLRRNLSLEKDSVLHSHKLQISALKAEYSDEKRDLVGKISERDMMVERLQDQLHEMKTKYTQSQMEMLKTNWGMK